MFAQKKKKKDCEKIQKHQLNKTEPDREIVSRHKAVWQPREQCKVQFNWQSQGIKKGCPGDPEGLKIQFTQFG